MKPSDFTINSYIPSQFMKLKYDTKAKQKYNVNGQVKDLFLFSLVILSQRCHLHKTPEKSTFTSPIIGKSH